MLKKKNIITSSNFCYLFIFFYQNKIIRGADYFIIPEKKIHPPSLFFSIKIQS